VLQKLERDVAESPKDTPVEEVEFLEMWFLKHHLQREKSDLFRSGRCFLEVDS
jgi:hypothetical protein